MVEKLYCRFMGVISSDVFYLFDTLLMGSNMKTRVIEWPTNIVGDLKSKEVPTRFGFDTTCKIYAETIGNVMIDARFTGKYYHCCCQKTNIEKYNRLHYRYHLQTCRTWLQLWSYTYPRRSH